MLNLKTKLLLQSLLLTVFLSACGGGGGGSTTADPGGGEGNGGTDTGTGTGTGTANCKSCISGQVDSSLINRSGVNMVYIYVGNVTPDDLGSAGIEPVSRANVQQIPGTCSWAYSSETLVPGEYTVAFTNEAVQDDAGVDDVINFVGTAILTIQNDQNRQVQEFVSKNIIQVGPTRAYKKPSEIIGILKPGDVVEIDAGEYLNDTVVWRTNNITLRGVGAGRVHLKSTQDIANRMGIWVMKNSDVRVENIEFSGATVIDLNGAGIRMQGNNLYICNGYFHDNQNGLLGGGGNVFIEYSEFNNNGKGDPGRNHNIYIDGKEGNNTIFTFQHSYSHHARIGHNIKSRAKENYILYSRIMDESDGKSSYAIDTPNGGLNYFIGNLIQQGPYTDNPTAVSYGTETTGSKPNNYRHLVNELYFINNTVVDERGGSNDIFITAKDVDIAKVINNIFHGTGIILNGTGEKLNNLRTTETLFVDQTNYDYHLLNAATAVIDKGMDPGTGKGIKLSPVYEYKKSLNRTLRKTDAILDIGAYEY